MKLVLRILPTVFVLISNTAFADTVRENLGVNAGISPRIGMADLNAKVFLVGQGVLIEDSGGTVTGWFDFGKEYFPGDPGLGPTTVTWGPARLQIGSTFYTSDQFELSPTLLNIPGITFPTNETNGEVFTVTFPLIWTLDGTINTNCPSSGCDFSFSSQPGKLNFAYLFNAGGYFAEGATFSTPEPGTLGLMAAGLAGIRGVFKKRKRPALSN
jgi:hypothetical protein